MRPSRSGHQEGTMKIIQRLFRYETMTGAGQCPTYMERWTILAAFGCALYLHHFLGDDWSRDPHDHPRRFVSLGLKGWYFEDVFDSAGKLLGTRKYQAPWLRTFPANHIHRIRAKECGNAWTLVLVFPKARGWGFIQDGKWIPFRDYVFGGKSRKDC